MTAALLMSAFVLQASTQMTISVSGLPEGVEPKMEVTAPDGSKHLLNAGQPSTFSLVGNYSISGETFRNAGQIIDMIYDAGTVKGALKSGESKSLTLKYAPRGGTGRLWTVSTRINEEEDDLTKGQIRSLTQSELEKGGFKTGSRIFEIPARAGDGVVTGHGSLLYFGGWDEPHIMRVSSNGLGSNGTRAAVAETEPLAISIDPKGRIWLLKDETAVCYPAGSFEQGSAPKPSITLNNDPDSDSPITFGHAIFDHDGSMILFGKGWIQRVPASELTKSGTIQKNATTTETGSINGGALDKDGNLWLTDENSSVWKFPRNDDGSFSASGTQYSVPLSVCGIAIDNEGGVWVLIRYSGELLRLDPGSSEFKVKGLFGRGHTEWSKLVLNPPPAWSPLAGSFPKTRLGAESE